MSVVPIFTQAMKDFRKLVAWANESEKNSQLFANTIANHGVLFDCETDDELSETTGEFYVKYSLGPHFRRLMEQ